MTNPELYALQPPKLHTDFSVPEGWAFKAFTHEGLWVRYGYTIPKYAKGLVIALPGLSEFCEKYFELAHTCLARGYGFMTLDWPGQGLSDRFSKGHGRRLSRGYEFERDLLHALITDEAKSIITDLPLSMLAHSMGGNIGLRYVHEYPDVFSAAGFSAPMWGMHATRHYPRWLSHIIASTGNTLASDHYAFGQKEWHEGLRDPQQTNIYSHDTARNDVHAQWCACDNRVRMDGVTWRWLYESVRSCDMIQSKSFAQSITLPVLVATAGQDFFVDNAKIKRVLSHLPDAESVHFEDAFHEILMEINEYRDDFLDRFFTMIAAG